MVRRSCRGYRLRGDATRGPRQGRGHATRSGTRSRTRRRGPGPVRIRNSPHRCGIEARDLGDGRPAAAVLDRHGHPDRVRPARRAAGVVIAPHRLSVHAAHRRPRSGVSPDGRGVCDLPGGEPPAARRRRDAGALHRRGSEGRDGRARGSPGRAGDARPRERGPRPQPRSRAKDREGAERPVGAGIDQGRPHVRRPASDRHDLPLGQGAHRRCRLHAGPHREGIRESVGVCAARAHALRRHHSRDALGMARYET